MEPKEARLEDCIRLLRGDSDEQRLVGLLLATKFVQGDDLGTVRTVFDAIGFNFINRLIKTGSARTGNGANKRQYFHLGLSILAAFSRLPALASSDEIISKVPLLMTTLGSMEHKAAEADCYECLLAVAVSSENGMQSMLDCRALAVIARHLHNSASDAPWIPVALKFFHAVLLRVAAVDGIAEYSQDVIHAVPPVATQLSLRQDAVKFEALSLLYSLLVSDVLETFKAVLEGRVHRAQWPAHARTGLGQILHSRVGLVQKYQALELTEVIVGLVGEPWLTGAMEFPQELEKPPPDRFFLLVLETLRVETAVLLNEVAQILFGDEGVKAQSSTSGEAFHEKQRRLMKCFALLEYAINLVATQESSSEVNESTLQSSLVALDEVTGIILEFLEDAKTHGQSQGDVLLAAVRVVSRYLAEAPLAHQQRLRSMLPFLLSVSSASDNRPFLAVQFLLPFLTQMTLELEGCTAFLETGSHKQVVQFFAWEVRRTDEEKGSMVDVCDVLLNLLTKKEYLIRGENLGDFIELLPSLVIWSGQGISNMESAMAACVCTFVLGLTNEKHLENRAELGPGGLHGVFGVVLLKLQQYLEEGRNDQLASEDDLLDMIISGTMACVDRYPSFKLELQGRVHHAMENRASSSRPAFVNHPSLQLLVSKASQS